MKTKLIKLPDTVALLENIPARKLRAGEVRTIVELFDAGVFEVEFCDVDGQTYAQFALRADQIMPLHSQGRSVRMASVGIRARSIGCGSGSAFVRSCPSHGTRLT